VADTDALLQALTLEEKAALTAGDDFLSTVAVDRLGIPKIHVTDGPNGARGLSFPGLGGPAATAIPCGSAIGATWDPELAERLGAFLGREALDRNCRGLLAPTVNLHRSPLAGRNFECYSEDPLLSGRLAAGYIRGVQSQGVFATVKHFVGNDAEYQRGTMNSVIDERALRELYLVPFELAVREGGVAALMTSYNRLNGKWLTEQPRLLMDVLRDEWGFKGLVMTDWFATTSTANSLAAGLDLEMPGPGRSLGSTLVAAIKDGQVDEADLDAAVTRLLRGLDGIGALDAPVPPFDPSPPTDDERAMIRGAAAEAIVLLTNDGSLPLELDRLKRVAVIGPNALRPRTMGGGSAAVIPHQTYTLPEVLAGAIGDQIEVVGARGCEIDLTPTVVGRYVLRAADGFVAEVFDSQDFDGEIIARRTLDELRLFVLNALSHEWPEGEWSLRLKGTVVPEESGTFQLALAQAGKTRVWVDGVLVLDGVSSPPPPGGVDFFGQASQDLLAEVEFDAGRPVEVVAEFSRVGDSMAGFRVGFRSLAGDDLLDNAVEVASGADVAIVCVGTSEEWETETRDRPSMQLPGRQDELIRRVVEANPHTIVVVNAGAPVDMSWSDEVSATMQCWFGGQEMAGAIVDVLTGASEPGGRLATTIPVREEHGPSYDNFPGENGELRYGEGVFMGYRGFDHRRITPRFAFGHGLSYTTFELGSPVLSATQLDAGEQLSISVPVTNTGDRAGSQVIQCYVAPPPSRSTRPPKELKAFGKVRLAAGETATVELTLDERSFAYWNPGQADAAEVTARSHIMFITASDSDSTDNPVGWQVESGSYEVLIGTSSDAIVVTSVVDVHAKPAGMVATA
jgi:beta-glucosidase